MKLMGIYLINWNGIFDFIEKDSTYNIVDENAANIILLWQDFLDGCGQVAKRHKGKQKIVVLQHGFYSCKDYIANGRKLTADYFLCWGNKDFRDLNEFVKKSKSNCKVIQVGCTVMNDLPKKKINILFAPDKASINHLDENADILKYLLEQKKIYGFNLVLKIVQSQINNYKNIDAEIVVSNQRDKEHLSICKNVISSADLVIGTGTFTLIAKGIGIKTLDFFDVNFKNNFINAIKVLNVIPNDSNYLAEYAGDYKNSLKNFKEVMLKIYKKEI